MGCFNHKCNFSQLPVAAGDRIVVIVGIRPIGPAKDVIELDNFAPGNSFTPISVPIRGEYNDYGSIENVDRTPGVEVLENFFGLSVETIVDCAERVSCGCKDQVKEDYKKIHNILNKDSFYSFYYKKNELEFTYIMEHEAIFDSLIAIDNVPYKNRQFWRIPNDFIEDLGYKKNIKGKERGYDIIEWTHDTLPKLIEDCYIWKVKDKGDYGKVCDTIEEFAKYIGCEIPEKYNRSYYETCFLNNIEKLKETDNLEKIFARREGHDKYSFFRFSEYGLFHLGEHSGIHSYFLCSFGTGNEHMQEKYMKEIVEIAGLYGAMMRLQMTWGNTSYYNQDINYDNHINFLNKCLEVAKEKKSEHDYIEEDEDE